MDVNNPLNSTKPSTGKSYQVIICDDDLAYGEMLSEYLTIACDCEVTRVMSSSELWLEVLHAEFDVLFLDFQLPGANGLEILEKELALDLGLPTVMMTGQGNEEVAVRAMQLGALEYLIKGKYDFNILPRIIEKAIHYRTLRRDIRESQNRNEYQANILNNVQDAVVVWDSNGRITYWNQSADKIFGTVSASMIGRPVAEVYYPLFTPPISSQISFTENISHSERQLAGNEKVWVSSQITRFLTQGERGAVNHYMDVTRDITVAKQEHKALEQNQYMINRILEANPNIVFLFNLVYGEVTFIIPNQEPILSMAVERIFTQSSSAKIEIHPDDLSRIEANLEELPEIQEHKITTIDFRIRTNENAVWQWLLIREAAFTRNQAGEIEDIIGVCEDITDQKKTEEKLELRLKSERFLSSVSNQLLRINDSNDEENIFTQAVADAGDLIDSCAGFLLLREKNTLVEKARSATLNKTGLQIDPVRIDLEDDVFPWQSKNLISQQMQFIPSIKDLSSPSRKKLEFLSSQDTTAAVIIPIAYQDNIYGVLLFGLKHWNQNFENEHGYMLTTLRQIILNAQMQNEIDRQLRLSEARYRGIVDEYQTEMICRFTPNFDLTFANTAYCHYYNISRNEALNTSFLQFIVESDVESMRKSIREARQSSEVTQVSFLVFQAGREKWQEWIIRPIVKEDQVLVEYQAVGRDITQRKEMESQISAAQTRLAQANRLLSIGQLATSMAHQINNPLTTIIADAQILASKIPTDDPDREAVAAIVSAGWRVQQIVDELLKFSSSDETKQKVNIRESIEKSLVLSSSQVLAEISDLNVTVPPHLTIDANMRQIEDLWLNLLLGITQKKRENQSKEISISIQADEIPDGLMVRLFCANLELSGEDGVNFFEPDLVPTSSKWRTGMELSICREIVRQNNGTIKVTPEGNDAIISIIFPGRDQKHDL